MSKDTDKSLFILPSMPRLYQQILTGVASYEVLGKRIIERINLAHAFRQIEQVKELAKILINIPIREYQLIAQYYLVWCKCRDLDYHTDVLERIIEQSRTYKAKALISRAAFEVYQGNTNNALYFYSEAIKASLTLSEYIEASRGVAMVKSLEGFSKTALTDLEAIIPVTRHAEPAVYYSVLNSYAVELDEVGRKDEAENVSRLTIASPLAPYYPEWQSTYSEIRSRRKRRSTISVSRSQVEWVEDEEIDSQPAETNLIPFPVSRSVNELMSMPVSSPETLGREITPIQLLGIVLKVKLRERITDEEVDRICMAYFNAVMDIWPQK
nr:hypothetical protein [uncultured bacterium]